MGKSRAAAFALGIQDIDEGAHINSFSETVDSHDSDSAENPRSESNFFFFCYSENHSCIICPLKHLIQSFDNKLCNSFQRKHTIG